MNHSTIKAQIYMSASWYSAESILFNPWSSGVMRVLKKVKHFSICFNGEVFENLFKKNHWAKTVQVTCKVI
jgi:hypothetical protein